MTKAFENRVKREGTVDTKNYRYRFEKYPDNTALIKRIAINKLDTMAAYTDWETVKEFT